jgi:hypothetical protein
MYQYKADIISLHAVKQCMNYILQQFGEGDSRIHFHNKMRVIKCYKAKVGKKGGEWAGTS